MTGTDLARARIGVASTFFAQGLLFITLTTHLPQGKERFGLDETSLSLLLLGTVLLAGVGSVVAEQLARRWDSAVALRIGMTAIALGLAGFALAPGFALAATLGSVYAVGLGVVDATGNMQAVALEHRYGRPILPSFHAAWTAGGITATVLALLTGGLSFSAAIAPLAVLPLLLVALAPLHARDHGEAAVAGRLDGLPWRRLLLVGTALILFYMVDTASSTWGPVYLHELGAPLENVALATLPYLVTTLLARMVGDWAVHRWGPALPLRAGGLFACGALAVVVFAPSVPVAVLGFGLLGLGVGVIAPLSFSAAASIAGSSGDAGGRARVDAVIARFNQFNYVGALIGAVLTGLVGADSLRVGFAVPMVLILGILPLARAFAGGAPARNQALV